MVNIEKGNIASIDLRLFVFFGFLEYNEVQYNPCHRQLIYLGNTTPTYHQGLVTTNKNCITLLLTYL